MSTTLLIIDPQNDFLDIEGAALPVPGAKADMERLAGFLRGVRNRISDLVITLDSHASVGIERTTFWMTGAGGAVPPFTVITEADVAQGRFKPHNPDLLSVVTRYLRELERQGRYQLMVWPVHCVLGTWGHNIHSNLSQEILAWEAQAHRGAFKVLKGQNPMTEQYSAVRAEVVDSEDPDTGANLQLIARARPQNGLLLIAGEASSHCVKATVEHLIEHFVSDELKRMVLLEDCMSPVAGFESQALELFDSMRALGARVITSEEAATLL